MVCKWCVKDVKFTGNANKLVTKQPLHNSATARLKTTEIIYQSQKTWHQWDYLMDMCVDQWYDWVIYCLGNMLIKLLMDINFFLSWMSVPAMNYWVGKFPLEAQVTSSEEYNLAWVVLRRKLTKWIFWLFWVSWCAWWGNEAAGQYTDKKKASVITSDMEESLWEKDLLGGYSPRALVDTLMYLLEVNFALRSGDEHRHLTWAPISGAVLPCSHSPQFQWIIWIHHYFNGQ